MNKILFISIYSHLPYSETIKKSLIKNEYTVYEPEYYEWYKVEDDKVVQEKQNEKYMEALSDYDIDWVLVINHSYVNRRFFDECHEKRIKVFAYTMDSIRWCDYATDYLHDYAGIYSYEPSDCEINTISKKIEYLPIGYDAEILYDEANREYKYDLCFVGSLDKKRITVLEKVAKYAKNNQKKFVVYTSIQLKNSLESPLFLRFY